MDRITEGVARRGTTGGPGALLWLAASLALAAPSSAATIALSAAIDGAQADAGAGTGSPATGSASITFDTDTNLLSWDIGWSGLQGSILAAHFHGPAAPDQTGGIQVDIGAISGLISPSIGSATITGTQAGDLLSHLWYINIHTDLFLGGEIRGQVVPEPSSVALLLGGLALLAAHRRGG